jgi:hypothetical protein
VESAAKSFQKMPLSRFRPFKKAAAGPVLSKDFISRRIQEELDDQAPGTSTEEDFIEDEDEDDRLEWESSAESLRLQTPVSSRAQMSPPRKLKGALIFKPQTDLNADRHSLVFKLFRWPVLVIVFIIRGICLSSLQTKTGIYFDVHGDGFGLLFCHTLLGSFDRSPAASVRINAKVL